MKRIKTLVVAVVISVLLSNFAVMPATAQDYLTGLNFSTDIYYDSPAQTLTLPKTFEANLYFPLTQRGRGGVIIGTYSDAYTPCFNFEIGDKGVPRIYIIGNDEASTVYDITFPEISVYTGKLLHLAITADYEKGEFSCYIDGALKKTVSSASPTPFQVTSPLRFGGDFRAGSKQYFRGVLQKVTLYGDIREDGEIAADAVAKTINTDGAIYAYDLTGTIVGTQPDSIPSIIEGGAAFKQTKSWLSGALKPKKYAYSFAVLGDIQNLTWRYPDKLPVLFDWIKDNAKKEKIKFCIGLGDVSDKNMESEYKLVVEQYIKLMGTVPFSIIRGNHDRDDSTGASFSFSKYITKEKYQEQITGAFDDSMLNTYRIEKIGKVKYLFLNLDYILSDPVLDWANEVISQNKDCAVVVSTHIYYSSAGKFYPVGENTSLGGYGAQNNGETLWNKVLSKHENVVLLLCGHSSTDNILYKQRKGENGNVVTEMLIDPQQTDVDFGGVGLVAMFYFSADGKNLDVRYYSTVKEAYFKENNQFSLTLDIPEASVDSFDYGVIIAIGVAVFVIIVITTVFLLLKKRKNSCSE